MSKDYAYKIAEKYDGDWRFEECPHQCDLEPLDLKLSCDECFADLIREGVEASISETLFSPGVVRQRERRAYRKGAFDWCPLSHIVFIEELTDEQIDAALREGDDAE